MKLNLHFLITILTIIITGCSHSDKKAGLSEVQAKQDSAIADFEKANRLLDENQHEEAAKAYDRLLVDYPGNQLDMVILFNSGIAHYQAKNCELAAERFRKVIRLSNTNYVSFKARALLRMSDVYTCLGQDNKAITNLIEIHRGRYSLPPEIVQAEVPARLAGAYARIGNNKEAERYFKIAERGLIQIQNLMKESKKGREILAKTLFTMGSINQLNVQTMGSEDYFSTIVALQKYLYKAIEYNDPSWSKQAFDQVMQAYQNSWQYIERVPLAENPDVAIAERQQKIEQLRVAHLALYGLKQLYSERIPDPNESEIVGLLLQKIKQEENKLKNFVATNIVGTSLTPEALKAESIRRVGRVLNPDPILERRAEIRDRKSKNALPEKVKEQQ
jgi:tetratricopeptide (TPR) repeat protein